MHKSRNPTMHQVGRKAAKIREGWSEAERRRRAGEARRYFALLSLLSETPILALG